jgi:hypothetical protein
VLSKRVISWMVRAHFLHEPLCCSPGGLNLSLYSFASSGDALPDFGALGDSLLFETDESGLYCDYPDGGSCLVHPNGTAYRTNVAGLASRYPGIWAGVHASRRPR